MAREAYQEITFRPATMAMIGQLSDIIDEYVAQGFRLTVRQLYYQLVARGVIENTERSYKRTTSLVNDARLAGLLDWDAIEDRTREFIRRQRWESGAHILATVEEQYHMDMWDRQPTRVFVIVEKEALAGVLEPICREFDLPLLAARGYPSGTVLREFAISDLVPVIGIQRCVILHLGDHDPSGIDMSRDLEERIRLFAGGEDWDVSLHRIALNMHQIRELRPPPNPAKTTDARFAGYRRKYGDESWELDALEPRYLSNLIRQNTERFIEQDLWDERLAEVNAVRDRLRDYAAMEAEHDQ